MSCETVIEARGLGKCYALYERSTDRLIEALGSPLERLTGHALKPRSSPFWALRDLNLSIGKGESVAIVGPNGSGKSTLLQMLYGTLGPTEGTVQVNGRMSALLELGAGFNPEFTGRENARLAIALAGCRSSEVESRLREIEAFAEIDDFFDRPVKLYSSGMYVRLAFAAAISSAPDVLIVDEALAVGDHYFQVKCYQRLRDLLAAGTTLLFVSHAMALVKSLCTRAIVMDKGRKVFDGSVDEASDHYLSLCLAPSRGRINASTAATTALESQLDVRPSDLPMKSLAQPPFEKRLSRRFGTSEAQFADCLLIQDGKEVTTLVTGRRGTIRTVLAVTQDCPQPGEIGIVVSTIEGIELFAINSLWEGVEVPPLARDQSYIFDFEFEVPLGCDARYRIDLGYRMPVQGEYVDKALSAAVFDVCSEGARDVRLLFRVPASVRVARAPSPVI